MVAKLMEKTSKTQKNPPTFGAWFCEQLYRFWYHWHCKVKVILRLVCIWKEKFQKKEKKSGLINQLSKHIVWYIYT